MATEQPTQLGKYTLIERIAVGGMAELFLARASGEHGFEKVVVLKRILPSFAENPDFTQMFLAEARLAAALVHPNIAQVFDFGQHDGTYYFTMEYVRGRDLRQILRAAQAKAMGLPLSVVLQIITGILAGLHHAHEQRDADGQLLEIVHRDVSPANALVTYEGNIKVVDFGIAKVAALGPATLSGTVKGKVSYMSPEQCRGETLDRRSDLFSVGILLWEMTVGRRLFGGSPEVNQLATLKLVDEAKVERPGDLVPHYPDLLESIVMRALQRDRDDRFETAHEFRLALEDFAREERLPMSSASTQAFMDELFPPSERGKSRASTGTFRGAPGPSGDGDAALGDPTRPESSSYEPHVTPVGTDTLRPPSRPTLVGMGLGAALLLLLMGGAYAVWGGAGPPEDDSEARPAAPKSAAGPAAAVPAQQPAEPPTEAAGNAPDAGTAEVLDAGSETGADAAATPEVVPERQTSPTDETTARERSATTRRSKKSKVKAKPKPETESEPKPDAEPKPSQDDIFMVPDHSRDKGGEFQ